MLEARAGYAAGAVTTTHLFNAMIGVVHREPGLALEALLDDAVWVELIADTLHVDPVLWPLIWRLKPAERVLLVSDAIMLAGSGRTRGMLGELEVRVDGDMATLVEGGNLAGSVTALDLELRNVVRAGVSLPDAVRAASTNPAGAAGPDRPGASRAPACGRTSWNWTASCECGASCAPGSGSPRPEADAQGGIRLT